jgi:hypothetical protein
MAKPKSQVTFFRAIEQATLSVVGGPVNRAALQRDKHLALEKASNLLGYQNYLTQARRWKAARGGVSRSFEREVQAQAREAFADVRELAASTLRITRQLKQAGELDRMLDAWIAGVKASGPVQVQDLWNEVENDPRVHQLIKDDGVSDEVWAGIAGNIKKLEGRVFLQGGKLAAEVKLAGQELTSSMAFTQSPKGIPRKVSDLLRRGQFERMVEAFDRGDTLPLSLDVVEGGPGEVELSDVVLACSILSVQQIAQHKNKLQDTGLATYAGSELSTALIVAGIILVIIGTALAFEYCGSDSDPSGFKQSPSDNCAAAFVLWLVGMLLGGAGVKDKQANDPMNLMISFERNKFVVVSLKV